MSQWTRSAGEVAAITNGRVVGDPSVTIASFAIDSRTVEPGQTFVALRDERDGHAYVAHAFEAGAVAAIVETDQPVPAGRTTIVVPNVFAALAALAQARRADLSDVTVIGVAGSTGKTSTKDLTATALGAGRRVHANRASWNNEFGVPLTVLAAPPATEALVIEMGERRPGDISYLCHIVDPTIGIVTNVGVAHAELLGGPAGVAAVLGELVAHLPTHGHLVVDADDAASAPLRAQAAATVCTIGSNDADVRIHDIGVDHELKVHASYATPWGNVRVGLPLRGVHHARNAAFALAVAGLMGVDLDAAAAALVETPAAEWRMHVAVTPGGVVVINDAYNANPASMAAGVDALALLDVAGARVAVLGEMRELGSWSTDAHAALGAHVAHREIDRLIVVGAGVEALAAAALDAGVPTETVADADAAIARLQATLTAGDAVLVKASRAVGLERVADVLMAGERQEEQQ